MSGEAYGSVHGDDLEDLLKHEDDLTRMVEDAARLVGHYAPDFVEAVHQIQLRVRAARVLVESEVNNLHDPMKAFNWWQSGDCGEDQFKAALEEWRNAKRVVVK